MVIGVVIVIVSFYQMQIIQEWEYLGIIFVLVGFVAMLWGLFSKGNSKADVSAHQRKPYKSTSPKPL